MPENDKGFYNKYTVIKNSTGEEVKEETFTFNLETDPHAEVAMLAYADAIEDVNPTLALDIREFFG
jgi:hypothetical protein